MSAVITGTSLGGRAAVFGYSLWTNLVNSAKRHQILNTADELCGGRMPVYVETPSQAAVVPRVDSGGRLVSVMVVNVSIDSSPKLRIALRNCRGARVVWVTPEGGQTAMAATPSGSEQWVEVPELGPWAIGVIETGTGGGSRS